MKAIEQITTLKKYQLNVQLVLISLLQLLLSSCVPYAQKVEKIKVYAYDWDITSRSRWDSDVILRKLDFNSSYKITNKKTIKKIFKRVNQLEPLENFDGVNTRMVCEIIYSNGSIEELTFGGTKLAFYKGEVFEKDTVLISLIENQSKDHSE